MGTPIELPGAIRVTQTGQTQSVVSTTGTAPTNIPLNANLDTPRIVRVYASGLCHIKFATTASGTTAAATDILISPNGGAEFFIVKGQSFYSACLDTSSATTAVLNVVPVED